jgi:hypothetical protein
MVPTMNAAGINLFSLVNGFKGSMNPPVSGDTGQLFG